MTIPLKIALTADPELPVPPRLYGGIERIIDMLARGLTKRGHEVTLFAHPDSGSAGRLHAWPGASSRSTSDSIRNSMALGRRVACGSFDIVHSFSRIAYLAPILPLSLPKIMSYQREISPRTVRLGHALSRGTLSFTAISNWMMEPVKHIGSWDMIPNGVPIDTYSFRPSVSADAPLVFLGRIEEIKGPHLAIEIARKSKRKLIIAGNIPNDKQHWFARNISPYIDGDQIKYVGSVDDEQKNSILGGAAALLMPIMWDEPFGIVMAEAMACGTPVLGLRRGAVPEVVISGITGFIGENVDELVDAVDKIHLLDRKLSRARVEKIYGASSIVESYESLYFRSIKTFAK